MRIRPALALLIFAFGATAAASDAAAKDKPKPPPVATGISKLDFPPNYISMSVPADYDAKKYYPLLFVLHPSDQKPDDYVGAWATGPLVKTWIVAGLYSPIWDNEETLPALKNALAMVKSVYKIDERRIVLAGHNAGALMAWRLWTREPSLFAAHIALSGEISDPDRTTSALKKLEGRPCYLFRGAKDTTGYSASRLEADKKFLEAMKLSVTVEVKPDWSVNFPTDSLPAMSKWIDGIWPPGSYREKATEVESALESKDLQRIQAATSALQAELRRSPYPAFDAKLAGYNEKFLELGRAPIEAAKKMVAGGQPLMALEAMEAAAKASRGLKVLEAEAAAALVALKKDPAVVEALRKKEAEASASSYMERASAAEAKGDLAKALEWYRKASALGQTSKKAEIDAKIKELEPKVAPK